MRPRQRPGFYFYKRDWSVQQFPTLTRQNCAGWSTQIRRARSLIGVRSAGAFIAREDIGLAADIGRTIDLLPETSEVVTRRDRRNQDREIDGGDRDPLNGDDQVAELPVVPAMGEDCRDDRDD